MRVKGFCFNKAFLSAVDYKGLDNILAISLHPRADTGNAKTTFSFISLLSRRYFRFCLLSSLSRKMLFLLPIPTLAHWVQTFLVLMNPVSEQLRHLLNVLMLMQWVQEVVHSKSIDRQTDGSMANATNDWETRRTKIHWGNLQKNVTFDDIFKEKWNLCLEEMIHCYSRPSNIRNLCVLL